MPRPRGVHYSEMFCVMLSKADRQKLIELARHTDRSMSAVLRIAMRKWHRELIGDGKKRADENA